MKRTRLTSMVVAVLLLAGTMALAQSFQQKGSSGSKGGASMSFVLTSPSFAEGQTIPKQFTCSGADASPVLSWQGAPANAKAFALIMDDPDAPGGTWLHWLIWNFSGQTLSEGVPKVEELPDDSRQGRNDFKRIGYGGPCPPPGKPHRYYFCLYALDAKLDLKAGASRSQLEQAMKGHVLGQAQLMGTFGR